GVVEEVGPGVIDLQPGDHVILTFLPSCGRCRWCHTGHPTLCDLGAKLRTGKMLDDTRRMHLASDGRGINNFLLVSTYAEYTVVPEASVLAVPKHLPLEKICLFGCGFATGFGAATNAVQIKPGETVTVVGCGGLGLAAIQGAKLSGAGKIIAVDVHEEKLTIARKLGATHAVQNRRDIDSVVKEIHEITWGEGTDYSMEFVGGDQTDETADIAFRAIRKGGTMLMVGVGMTEKKSFPITPADLVHWQKTVQGVLFGDSQFRSDIPRYIELFEKGDIDLDTMITRELKLEDINSAFDAVLAGDKVARQVIRF
ncbi:MAG: zinc-binding dehydrogenase, partial [bacterium]